MPLRHCSFLTIKCQSCPNIENSLYIRATLALNGLGKDCNKDYQVTLLKKGTYSLALFSNLKQRLQFCKHFVNGVHKNYWDIVLFAHYDTPTSTGYAENLSWMPLLTAETIAKKYSKTQEATLKFLTQGELKFLISMD